MKDPMLSAALLFLQSAVAPDPDWGQLLREDATTFRDAVLDSHPGPKDAENPGFLPQLQAAHAQALVRAKTARSIAAYTWGLRELTAAMNDGHLGIDVEDRLLDKHVRTNRWPGFVTALRGGKHVVVVNEERDGPLVGATLESCDGVAADALAEQRIGRFAGRWMLRSRREAQSGQLFLETDNPWLAPLHSCVFTSDGKPTMVTLTWRPIKPARRKELLVAAVGLRHHSPVGLERFDDGTVWINLGYFDADPQSAHGRELVALAAQVDREAAAIRGAQRIVVDLRGNNGGSSNWIKMIATSLWGKKAVIRVTPQTVVDWRVSEANQKRLQEYVAVFAKSRADNRGPYDGMVKLEAALGQARKKSVALWRQEPAPPTALFSDAPKVAARAFVLTDYDCASACLDAVDLMTALGAVQVGQETAADTQYMEIRGQAVADRATYWLPMKVYRGRKRGANVPSVPKYFWTGDMGDTPGLRRWIGGL